MSPRLWLLLVALTACNGRACGDAPPSGEDSAAFPDTGADTDTPRPDTSTDPVDADEDGYDDASDCDDDDPAVHPDAEETCDDRDEDCDGAVDEDAIDAGTWFADGDDDGFGDPGSPVTGCAPAAGTVSDGSDCDDGDDRTFPGATEVCDGVDRDCDGAIDDDAVDQTLSYADADADGFGDASTALLGCSLPEGRTADASDCDDANPSVAPGTEERCDGVDQDCDGETDEAAIDERSGFLDQDADGHGDPAAPWRGCVAPPGVVEDASDCDDRDGAVHPGAAETCDGVDQDCDAEIDEDAVDSGSWFADADADGFGHAAAEVLACARPDGTTADPTDCDDRDRDVHPGAAERCDERDEDCDGIVDEEAIDQGTWFGDRDGDGFGDAATAELACGAPPGAVEDGADCDDARPEVNPAAVERCNGLDDDCDGEADERSSTDASFWYRDLDQDGYGDPSVRRRACARPPKFVADATDCDDGDADRHPGAVERCDTRDEDCDELVDEDAIDARPFYADRDGDGYGDDAEVSFACSPPLGTSPTAGDCDDATADVHPDQPETCDGRDEDCDGAVDVAAVDQVAWYADDDGDGFGAGSATFGCPPSAGWSDEGTDCDDGDALAFPGARERCNGVDDDCDGEVEARCGEVWFQDWEPTPFIQHISPRPSGGFLLAGLVEFDSALSLNQPWEYWFYLENGDLDDPFVAEYAADGSLLRATAFGGDGAQLLRDVSTTPDGGSVVVGQFQQAFEVEAWDGRRLRFVSAAPTTSLVNGFVVRLDADGLALWAKSFASEDGIYTPTVNDSVVVWRAAVLPDGDVAVAGLFNGDELVVGAGEPNETRLTRLTARNGLPTGLLARLDGATGALEWAVAFGGPRMVFQNALAVFSNGDLLVDYAIGDFSQERAFLRRYDGDGNLLWERADGGSGYRKTDVTRMMPDDSFVTVGHVRGTVDISPGDPSELTLVATWSPSSYLARFGPDGRPIWGFVLEGTGGGTATVVWPTEDRVVFGGTFGSELWIGSGASEIRIADSQPAHPSNRDHYIGAVDLDGGPLSLRRLNDLSVVPNFVGLAPTGDGDWFATGRANASVGTNVTYHLDAATDAQNVVKDHMWLARIAE